ncbi:ParA family protein [Vibrio crassostreae]|uniref:ParA family protein n=1 Tax=Vibrio crassostreae TaxID=246167 RepID=UPI001B3188F7|nr:ParA family protein [Vibrio crassostreae]
MNILRSMDECIEQIDKQEVSLRQYVEANSRKNVTDVEVKTGVERLIYNHSVKKGEAIDICETSTHTFTAVQNRLIEEGRINEPVEQGKSQLYNRFDLQEFMREFGVSCYRDKNGALVIVVSNHKGGVGKSTTVKTMASKLALDTELNARIVIVDLDPQGSELSYSRFDPSDEESIVLTAADITLRNYEDDSDFNKFVEYYADDESVTEADIILSAALPTHLPNLDIYPSFPMDERFSDVYHSLERDKKGDLLAEFANYVIPVLKSQYDIIIVDTAPQDSPITWSALLAADILLTPVAPKYLDFLSTCNFVRFTRQRIEQLGADKNIRSWKVLPVMVNYDERSQERLLTDIRRAFPHVVMNNVIEKSSLFTEADALNRSIFDIMKSECKTQRIAPVKQYENAIASSTAVYRELKTTITTVGQDLWEAENV